jgi:hypothetical protein
MPRQFTYEKATGDFLAFKSPVPTGLRRHNVGDFPVPIVEAGPLNDLAIAVHEMSTSKMISQPDKNTSLKGLCHSLLFSIGAGVVDRIPQEEVIKEPAKQKYVKIKTDFSLLKIETDKTVIPNPAILDVKSMNMQMTVTPMIAAEKMFGAFEKDPFYEPEPQEENYEIIAKMKKAKIENTSNTIDLAIELVEFQRTLPSGMRLKAFRHARKKLVDPYGDNSNHEFKDFEDPNLTYDIQDAGDGTN